MRHTTISRLGTSLALAVGLAACSHNPPPMTGPQPTPRPRAAAPVPAPAPAAPVVPAQAPVAAPAAPAPAAAPAAPAAVRHDPTGDWEWSASMGGESYSGTMRFEQAGGGYTGTMSVAGMFDATIRSVTINGDAIRVVFDSPQGEMVMDAVFTDANNLAGRVDVASLGASAAITAHRK